MKNLVLCDDIDVEAVLPIARDEGLGIELQTFSQANVADGPAEELSKHLRLLRGFTGIRSLHGPFGDLCPGSSDRLVRELAALRAGQAVAIAKVLDVDHLVLHHGYVPNTSFPANWIARSRDFWRHILSETPSTTHIHMENFHEHSPDMMLELVQEVGDSRFGICLDVGHAHAFSKRSVTEWIKSAGPLLTYVHLHDNNGSKDEHLPLGQGSLPVKEVLEALETHAPGAIWAVEADARLSLAWLRENGFGRGRGN